MLSVGSVWHRWDPHVHPPGTVLNNQYPAAGAWEEFIERIERSSPTIRTLGVTDYYSVDLYEAVVARQREGRLQMVELLFPNIEMRYGVGTGKGAPINVHLLISPDDPDHVVQARRLLRNLTFDAFNESFRCERADLIRLGKRHDKSVPNDDAALAVGTNQFKVNPEQLRQEWKSSAWMRENVLIAVAAGSHDGTSGLQEDASLTTVRREIERSAHIIFSGQPKQVEFWLGRGTVTAADLQERWGGPKPCIHGSDAHTLEAVGEPDFERRCWLKGELRFETLRQACLEPGARVYIGREPPRGALPSHVISSVSVTKSDWLATPTVPLNAGLVAIIGARGSGKTALADVLAAGGFALGSQLSDRSFLLRARSLLGDGEVHLTWEYGEPTTTGLVDAVADPDERESPRVQYLSQQFVDALCSAEGMTDALLEEVERIVYQAHPSEERMGTTSFTQLLDLRTESSRTQRERHEAEVALLTNAITEERERDAGLVDLEKRRKERAAAIEKDKVDRKALIRQGGEAHTKELDTVTSTAEKVRFKVEQLRRRQQALRGLKTEVADARGSRSASTLQTLRNKYSETGLSTAEWDAFRTDFIGSVDEVLAAAIKTNDRRLLELMGPSPGEPVPNASAPASKTSLLPQGIDPESLTLSLLDKEIVRLRALVGIDSQNAKTLTRLNEKISREEAGLAQLDRELERARQASGRLKEFITIRNDEYAAIFEAITEQEGELASLYDPLKDRLASSEGALGKLAFSVRRDVDIDGWAREGEALLDLRKAGPFKGHGALLEAANQALMPAWENGSAREVANAMAEFRAAYDHGLVEQAAVDRGDHSAFRAWLSRLSAWLYGTGHIKMGYGVQYDGVEIEQLSPGTRGIVLLLLYLALDHDDDRPLIIDQPEENLDPKSIFDELVERFRAAKLRRQVIVITHNANIVVNGDADQVIVASCGPHRPGQLPEITYTSGGLEDPFIRRHVCDILEGGALAFKERAKRLRLLGVIDSDTWSMPL
ncbi:MAG: TrlF family AAA-like ATPase [Candidatus Dormibacteraceae bacterium]